MGDIRPALNTPILSNAYYNATSYWFLTYVAKVRLVSLVLIFIQKCVTIFIILTILCISFNITNTGYVYMGISNPPQKNPSPSVTRSKNVKEDECRGPNDF